MQIFNRLKYASNSSAVDAVARVADMGKAVDSSSLNVLKEAIGSRGKYFTKAERMYVLANLDKQYQMLAAKAGSIPEASVVARELNELKNQVSNYSKQSNDSIVKRFKDGVVNVVDSVSSGISAIKRPSLAYAVPALAGVAMAAIMVGGNTGCRDVSAASYRQRDTNSVFQVLAPAQPNVKPYVQKPQVANETDSGPEKLESVASIGKRLDKSFGELRATLDKRDGYDAERDETLRKTQEGNERLAKENKGLAQRLDGATKRLDGVSEQLEKAQRDYRKANDELAQTRKGYEEVKKGLETVKEQVRDAREITAKQIKTLEGKLKGASAANRALQAEVNGYRAAEKREEARTEAECEREYMVGLAKANVKTELPKTASRPVQKSSQEDNVRSAKKSYLALAELEIAKRDDFNKVDAEYQQRKTGENKPKLTSFPSLNRVHRPGEVIASISGGRVNYNRAGVIDLSIPSGPRINYNDKSSSPKVVRALPVVRDETKKDKIDVKSPNFIDGGKKKKPTRWERKETERKYDKTDKNQNSKSGKDNRTWVDCSVPVEPILTGEKRGLGKVFGDLNKARQSAADELSRNHETNVMNTANGLAAGGYRVWAAISGNQGTPKNHPELNEDDLRPEIAARNLWASVVDLGRRLAGPLNKIERERAYEYTEEGEKKGILGLSWFERSLFGLGNVAKNTVNTVTFGLGNNVIENAEAAFGDFVGAGANYGAAWVNLGREGLVRRLTPGAQIGADKVVDWVGLVPLSFARHVVTGKGISHHENLPEAVGNEGYARVTSEGLADLFMMFGSGFFGESGSGNSFTSSFGGGIRGSSGGVGGLGGGIGGVSGGR